MTIWSTYNILYGSICHVSRLCLVSTVQSDICTLGGALVSDEAHPDSPHTV